MAVDGPQLAIGIVIGVFAYSYYVFVVRLCVPLVRNERARLGSLAQGGQSAGMRSSSDTCADASLMITPRAVVYLVIYHLLFVHFVWTYWVAITTGPGFARDVSLPARTARHPSSPGLPG